MTTPDPRPLSAEEEAAHRRAHDYPVHLTFSECVVCRFLATLDGERARRPSIGVEEAIAQGQRMLAASEARHAALVAAVRAAILDHACDPRLRAALDKEPE